MGIVLASVGALVAGGITIVTVALCRAGADASARQSELFAEELRRREEAARDSAHTRRVA